MNIKIAFTIALGITALALLFCIMVTIKKKGRVAAALRRVLVVTLITTVFNALHVLSMTQFYALAWMSVFSLSIDWLLLMLLAYIREYTDTLFKFRPFVYCLHILAVIDSVSMLLNIRYEHVFSLPGRYYEKYDLHAFPIDAHSLFYTAHLVFCYIISIYIFVILLQKTIEATSFYRKKYLIVLISFIVLLVLDAGSVFLHSPFNVSIIAYSVAAIVVTYISLSYIPKALVANMLKFVIRDLHNVVVCYDSNGKIIYANEQALDLMEKLQRMDYWAQQFRNWKHTYGMDEEPRNTWKEELVLDGKTVYFDINAQKLFDDNHHLIGVYFLYYDRTLEEKAHQDQLAEAQNSAEQQSRFWANISHEMRTPVNSILGMNEMILRESDNEDVKGYARHVQIATEALISLINDVLDFSKINADGMQIIPNSYETSHLLKNIDSLMKQKITDKGLEFDVQVDQYLPKVLLGDELRVQQIIINLLSNAVKYTETGMITLRVYGERRYDDFYLHVEVEDTGIGIREDSLPHLLDAYNRIDEARIHGIQGTGLGLTICDQLLRLMDSKLEVESEYRKGSRFSFAIRQPAMSDEYIITYEEYMKEREMEAASKLDPLSEKEVLLVDDNEMNCDVFCILLKHTKLHIDVCNSGQAALEILATKKYDVIFMDHLMPGMNGDEVLERLKADHNNPNQNTPMVMLTANVSEELKERFLNMGFADFLPKPVKPQLLEETLANFCK